MQPRTRSVKRWLRVDACPLTASDGATATPPFTGAAQLLQAVHPAIVCAAFWMVVFEHDQVEVKVHHQIEDFLRHSGHLWRRD